MATSISRPLRVFLCHSSDDKPTVRELYHRLDSEGWIDAWLDEKKLYPGQDWNYEIEQAVEEADVILVCLTKNSVTKEGYVQRELRIILDFADYKPEGTLYIIPVRLEECEPPKRIRRWQYADYFPEGHRKIAYQRLLESLKFRATRLGISTKLAQRETRDEIKEVPDQSQFATLKPDVQQKDEYRSRPSMPPRSASVLGARTSATPVALGAKLTVLQGVGPTRAAALAKLGLYTLGDMLYYYPRRYDDYSKPRLIKDLFYGEQISLIGTIQSVNTRPVRDERDLVVEVTISDGSGSLLLCFFGEPWLTHRFNVGDAISVSGKIDQHLDRLVINNPDWESVEVENLHTNRIVPIYSLTEGVTQKWLRKLMEQVAGFWVPRVVDALPESVRSSARLMLLNEALLQVHFPVSQEKLRAAHERLAFDEIFYLQMVVLRQKREWKSVSAKRFSFTDVKLIERARSEAQKLFQKDAELSLPEHSLLADTLEQFCADGRDDVSYFDDSTVE